MMPLGLSLALLSVLIGALLLVDLLVDLLVVGLWVLFTGLALLIGVVFVSFNV